MAGSMQNGMSQTYVIFAGLTIQPRSGMVVTNFSGTSSFGVGTPSKQSIPVHVTTDKKTAKSATIERTCKNPCNNVNELKIDWKLDLFKVFFMLVLLKNVFLQ